MLAILHVYSLKMIKVDDSRILLKIYGNKDELFESVAGQKRLSLMCR